MHVMEPSRVEQWLVNTAGLFPRTDQQNALDFTFEVRDPTGRMRRAAKQLAAKHLVAKK